MSKNSGNYRKTVGDAIFASPTATLLVGVAAILFGFLFFFLTTMGKTPIPREEADAYTGSYEKYTSYKNSVTLHFEDGSRYDLLSSRPVWDFIDTVEAGTELHLLINPNCNYVIEVKTNTEELLNFDAAQKEIVRDAWGYIAIAALVFLCGVFLIFDAILKFIHEKKQAEKRKKGQANKEPLRTPAEGKARILLEAQKLNYNICYRRVGLMNELVINGEVWDEHKALIEFEHCLSAVVDGNKIEAGYSEEGYSYICFNGHRIARKKRIL